MMANLVDIVSYICQRYPRKNDLSKGRLTKLVYLADWRSVLENGEQVSDITWEVYHYGPWVPDVIETVEANPDKFRVRKTFTWFGNPKEVVELTDSSYEPNLSPAEKEAIDYVIKATEHLNWDNFIRLVYSTYPVVTQPKYTPLNLRDLAAKYKAEFPEVESNVKRETT